MKQVASEERYVASYYTPASSIFNWFLLLKKVYVSQKKELVALPNIRSRG
jgi:hypothetical protein